MKRLITIVSDKVYILDENIYAEKGISNFLSLHPNFFLYEKEIPLTLLDYYIWDSVTDTLEVDILVESLFIFKHRAEEYKVLLIQYMNDFCITHNFKGEYGLEPFRACMSYVGFNSSYQVDAIIISEWLGQVIKIVEDLEESVVSGAVPMPNSFDDIILMLPAKPLL